MPASFLKIGGELVQDAILQLVEVTQELNQHWWCRVECRQTEDKRIPVENLLGQDFQIVTHDQAGAEHVVFDGFVLEASLLYEVFGSYTARLKAVTRSYKLDLTAQEAYYRKKTLTDVAQSLSSADGLSAEVRCKDGAKRNYVQWGDPDFRFLVRIADDHQAWIRPTAQGIQICDAFQRGAQVIWRQEDGLLSFDVEGGLGPPAFEGTHSDARQMRSVTHTAVSKPAEHFGSSGPMVAAVEKQSKARLPSAAAFLDSRAATAEEYKALLERESLRAAGNRVVGHGISQKEDLKAGDTVEIEGILDGKGTYGLTKVIHRWTAQGYENEFWCTPWKNYVSPRAPESSEVAGVVTARVVDHNDPRKMGRIQVQYDWQENGPTGWVRATTPHAGQDRGFLFMPEIGDEVVVAFEHGDPERPYVVGCLWNGVDQAPRAEFWGEDVEPNDVKRIVTKSGHRIQFVDKPGKESIVIATPQHLKISLIEKTDETGRSMILLHSDGDIFINAPGGRVHLRAASISQDVGGAGKASPPPKKTPVPPQPAAARLTPPSTPPPGRSKVLAPSTPRPLSPVPSIAKQAWDQGKVSKAPELKIGAAKDILDKELQPAAAITWVEKSGAAKRWGDDTNSAQVLAYNLAVSSGVTKEEGGYAFDAIKGEASISAFRAEEEKKFLGGLVKQTGSVDVAQASVFANVGAEFTKKAKKLTAEAGAEANLAKAEIGGELDVPIFFTKKVLTLGGGVEGSIGAAAKASADMGWTEKEGWAAGVGAKAAAGLGLGVWFKLGVRDRDSG